MQAKQIYFLYAQENENVAQNIKSQLKSSYLQWHDNAAVETLEKLLTTYPSKNDNVVVLALISDNLLKSSSCMRALSIFAQETGHHLLLPVIIPGQRKVDGNMEYYPTSIHSIQDTIAYRDFWYDEWIRLRKLGNTLEGDALAALEDEKNFSKRMQPLINPILRYINTAQAKNLEGFQDNTYQILFDTLGLSNLTVEERTLPLEQALTIDYQEPIAANAPSSTIQIVEDFSASINIVAENIFVESETIANESENAIEEVIINDEVLLPQIDMPFELDMDMLTETIVEPTSNSNMALEESETAIAIATDLDPISTNSIEEMPYSLFQKNEMVMEENEVIPNNNGAENIDQLWALAEYYTVAEQFATASTYYEQIIQREPTYIPAFVALAKLQAGELNDIAAAERTFKKVLLSAEENAMLYYEYGLFLQIYQPSQQRRAIELFHAALDLDAHFAKAYYALAKSYAANGQKDMAKMNYLQACLLEEDLQEEVLDNAFGILRPAKPVIVAAEIPEPIVINPNADTVVLVTGATSGIGQATAQKFINEGYKVILTGRRADRLESFKAGLDESVQTQVQILDFDVRDYGKIDCYLAALPEEFKNIDILINNAGLAKGLAPIHEGSWEHWEQMIDTNIKGLLAITRIVSAQMVKNGRGHIINIGSVAGKEAYPNGNVYAATKAAVDMLTRTMRIDLHAHNIRVSAIHPGMVETEFSLVRLDDAEKANKVYDNIQPLTGEDIADTVYYVATRPAHVNVQDVLIFCTQQASAQIVNRSGKPA